MYVNREGVGGFDVEDVVVWAETAGCLFDDFEFLSVLALSLAVGLGALVVSVSSAEGGMAMVDESPLVSGAAKGEVIASLVCGEAKSVAVVVFVEVDASGSVGGAVDSSVIVEVLDTGAEISSAKTGATGAKAVVVAIKKTTTQVAVRLNRAKSERERLPSARANSLVGRETHVWGR